MRGRRGDATRGLGTHPAVGFVRPASSVSRQRLPTSFVAVRHSTRWADATAARGRPQAQYSVRRVDDRCVEAAGRGCAGYRRIERLPRHSLPAGYETDSSAR